MKPDTINALSSHQTGQLSSLLTLGESSGLFLDYIPYEPWVAAAVSKDASASDTYLPSHTQGLEDCLTRLDQKIQSLEGLMSPLSLQIMAIEQKINLLIDAMADEDHGDDEPRRYMDGSPV